MENQGKAVAEKDTVDEIQGGLEELDAETIVQQARQTFGTTLPPNYLSEEEYKIYERLYGAPLRETRPEDVGISRRTLDEESKTTLFKETDHGVLEAVNVEGTAGADDAPPEGPISFSGARIDLLDVTANNAREYEALMKLQLDFDAAAARAEKAAEESARLQEEQQKEQEERYDEWGLENEHDAGAEYMDDADGDYHNEPRLHPHTELGRFGPSPSTVHLPKENLVIPIQELLSRTDVAHVQQTAEAEFGGPNLPDSPATPELKKNRPMKASPLDPGHHRMSKIQADVFIATVLPGVYASAMSSLVEVRKRLGSDWIRDLVNKSDGQGPRVLDVGGGGAGLAAWQEILRAEWEAMGQVDKPPGKKTVIVGSDHLRHRISRFLDDTTFLPRLPDYLHSVEQRERHIDTDHDALPQPRKVYDVIMASHALMPLDKQHKRDEFIANLWSMLSPEGGVLIVLEKGHPRGFEAVADVRSRLLQEFIYPPGPPPPPEIEPENIPSRVREPGTIIAPCTNHGTCPMYLTRGLGSGRKDFCHFSQRFIRPPFLQRVLGASHRNHEDIKFSFLAVRRGVHPVAASFAQGPEAADRAFRGWGQETRGNDDGAEPHALSLPRSILPPLKRRGHVTMDLCTPAGAIERWTVPKSFSRQAYHDARKHRWGDLWALGAKTRVLREPRIGRGVEAESEEWVVDINGQKSPKKKKRDVGVRARQRENEGKRPTRIVDVSVDQGRGKVDARERFPGGRAPVERRTKGGRKVRIHDLINELGGDELEADDEEERELRGF